MNFTVEVTHFIVRLGPDVKTPPLYEFDAAVSCVVADGEHAVMKALRPEVRFTTAHRRALQAAVESLGFKPKWFRANRKEWEVMPKEKIHHVSEAAGDDAAAMEHALHALAQVQEGHYKLESFSGTQEDVHPGRVRMTLSFDRVEQNINEPAA